MQFRQKLGLIALTFIALPMLAAIIALVLAEKQILSQLAPLVDVADPVSLERALDQSFSAIGSVTGLLILLFAVLTSLSFFLYRQVIKSFEQLIDQFIDAARSTGQDDGASLEQLGECREIAPLVEAFGELRGEFKKCETSLHGQIEQLEHQAMNDVLTGLSNRRKLNKMLVEANEQFKEDNTPYVFCVLDLDRFKIVNDVSGHLAGDAMLVQVAKMLMHSVRSNDQVFRMGGDEFALLMPYCDAELAYTICERIRKNIAGFDFWWKEVQHKIGVSIGILEVTQAFDHAEEIFAQADLACFSSKEMGRDQINMINMSVSPAPEEHSELSWIHRISNAISDNKMVLYTQAVVPLQTEDSGAAKKFEVLVRYYDEELDKLITPDEFMGYLERQGLILQLDKWVVDTTIEYAAYNYLVNGDVANYWINLSGKSISDEKFLQYLYNALGQVELPKGTINFEVTETSAIRNMTLANDFINQLRDVGCRFALDDFGTGLASFSNLKSLQVDVLKIDGSFVRNIVNNEVDFLVVKSAIEVAKAIGISTVAEYIESEEILEAVRKLGADFGQGYYWGKPSAFALSDESPAQSKAI